MAPSLAQAPVPLALQSLEKGAWEAAPRASEEKVRNICLGDPRQLLQLHHQRKHCTFHVVEDRANSVIVHYSCPGAGQGRTMLRIETSRLVQIHTQGVASGAPFALAYEARRKGECR
ncbi:DUF3617 domain-containing protein [Rhizorhapis suberifaciens]|uniref:Uncharacterized protein n=1 Tax=Rhizorhapis suberifaciens TaxID=13656 RepID=A0A840HU95_9SPHN|nr:hypothetical protein [Rhizorhapis suberifaciens]MBB4641128.1 hypothetical protein [Rhizorhapis suberifaciens]